MEFITVVKWYALQIGEAKKQSEAGFMKPVDSSHSPQNSRKLKYPKTMGSFPLATVWRGKHRKGTSEKKKPISFKNRLHRSLYSFLLFLVYLSPTQTTAPPSSSNLNSSPPPRGQVKTALVFPKEKLKFCTLIVYYLLR